MRGSEAFRQRLEHRRSDLAVRQRHRQFIVLSGIAHVDRKRGPARIRRNPSLLEPCIRLCVQGVERIGDHRQRGDRQCVQSRHGEIGAQVGQQQAHRAQDAGIARYQPLG